MKLNGSHQTAGAQRSVHLAVVAVALLLAHLKHIKTSRKTQLHPTRFITFGALSGRANRRSATQRAFLRGYRGRLAPGDPEGEHSQMEAWWRVSFQWLKSKVSRCYTVTEQGRGSSALMRLRDTFQSLRLTVARK